MTKLPWPPHDPEIAAALMLAYRDESWSKYHGPNCERLQAQIAAAWGGEHVFLCGSGTYAVELGLRALNVEPGDEVILADYDFPGNFLTIHELGATPVLVDVDAESWNLSISAVRAALSPKTKAIVASHLHGGVVPMRELRDAAPGVAILEDACQCPGAWIQGKRAGAWGDVGVVSFGGSKLLSAGRGGAVFTSRPDVAARARVHHLRGNIVCPLSELQAAVLGPQLAKLDERNRRRGAFVAHLTRALADNRRLRPFVNRVDAEPGYYKVGFQYQGCRTHLIERMHAAGFSLDVGFRAGHVGRSPKRYRAGSSLEQSLRAHQQAVVLHHPLLLEDVSHAERFAAALAAME